MNQLSLNVNMTVFFATRSGFTVAVGVLVGISVITTFVIDVDVYIIRVVSVLYIVSAVHSCDIGASTIGIIIVIIISGATIITVLITV